MKTPPIPKESGASPLYASNRIPDLPKGYILERLKEGELIPAGTQVPVAFLRNKHTGEETSAYAYGGQWYFEKTSKQFATLEEAKQWNESQERRDCETNGKT